ncbi:hypothetical protein AAFF_G00008690 [Aldrovandia affinis]|uniref:Uncharacterized protein n=1 Tax=Aldrovandia affinis TaxID=143900 RepID=A0AAD7T6C5_9TELE|nr:hypothetical protein AAFF_G00008690 [Aldrovandia affinis]
MNILHPQLNIVALFLSIWFLFDTLWEKFMKERETTEFPAAPSQKRRREVGIQLRDYVVDTTVGQQEVGEKTECRRLYFSTLDAVVGKMSVRFSERKGQLVEALCTLHPGSECFMDVDKVRPLLDLTGTEFKEAEFAVAWRFLLDEIARSDENWTTQNILQRYWEPLAAMPTVIEMLKLSLTFGASTATCEN